jgi:hypothetical protein
MPLTIGAANHCRADQKAGIEGPMRGYGAPTAGPVGNTPLSKFLSPTGRAETSSGTGPYPFSIAKAKALLASHGQVRAGDRQGQGPDLQLPVRHRAGLTSLPAAAGRRDRHGGRRGERGRGVPGRRLGTSGMFGKPSAVTPGWGGRPVGTGVTVSLVRKVWQAVGELLRAGRGIAGCLGAGR